MLSSCSWASSSSPIELEATVVAVAGGVDDETAREPVLSDVAGAGKAACEGAGVSSGSEEERWRSSIPSVSAWARAVDGGGGDWGSEWTDMARLGEDDSE